jgi:ribosomal protein L11 methylase PrmA
MLSVAAALRDADLVVGIDCDPSALKIAQKNVQRENWREREGGGGEIYIY